MVSCAGPDDFNDPAALVEMACAWPEMELAVQLSVSRQGTAEYPSSGWLDRFADALAQARSEGHAPAAAIHLNGAWCRAACSGVLPTEARHILDRRIAGRALFERLQLNFDAPKDGIQTEGGLPALLTRLALEGISPILQAKPCNMDLLASLEELAFDILFDTSGGLGIRSGSWPAAIAGRFNAWAGGLGPETAAEDIPAIADVAAAGGMSAFGIDAQRRLRTDGRFDPLRAMAFAAAARAWNRAPTPED